MGAREKRRGLAPERGVLGSEWSDRWLAQNVVIIVGKAGLEYRPGVRRRWIRLSQISSWNWRIKPFLNKLVWEKMCLVEPHHFH